jgi:hypothetical protein
MKRKAKAPRIFKKKLSPKVYVIGIIAVLVAIVYVGAVNLNPALLSFGAGKNQLATPLPFANECYKDGIFECTDYAYEYCQQNGVKNCYLFIIRNKSGAAGHVLNIIEKPISKTVSRMIVIEPQTGSDDPITTWDQSTNKKLNVPDSVFEILAETYTRSNDPYTPEGIKDRFLILYGNVKYQDFYKEITGNELSKPYWTDGWFPVNALREVTDRFYKVYKPAGNRIPTCGSLQGTSCSMQGQLNLSNKQMEYSARVCLDKLGYPATTACINNKMQAINRGQNMSPVTVTPTITTSSVCPMSEINSSSKVTFTINAPQLAPISESYYAPTFLTVGLYINGKFYDGLSPKKFPVTFTINASEFNKKDGLFTANDVHAFITVNSLKTKNNPVIKYTTNTVPMNVGQFGCVIARIGDSKTTDTIYYKPGVTQKITSLDKYTYLAIDPYNAGNFPPFQLKFNPVGWMPKSSMYVPVTIRNLTSVILTDTSKNQTSTTQRNTSTVRPSYTPATTPVVPDTTSNTNTNTNTQISNGSGSAQGSGVGSGS